MADQLAPRAGSRRWPLVVALALVLVVAGGGGVLVWRLLKTDRHTVRIATGGKGGTYFPLGTGIAEVLNQKVPHLAKASVLSTSGSIENMRLLESGEVELAFCQNDTEATPGNPHQIRTVAVLYEEVLHVLVRSDLGVGNLDDLGAKVTRPLAIGGAGSGTEALARRILEHFSLSEVPVVSLGTLPAVDALRKGEIAGLCVLSGLKSDVVQELLTPAAPGEEPLARLVSLGSVGTGSAIDGVRFDHPYVTRKIIPARTYGGQPRAAVGTVAVKALMLARADLDETLTKEIARTIFHNKVSIAQRCKIGARLTERPDEPDFRFPVHPGALAYYFRDEPPFLVAYAEAISLGLTVLVGAFSVLLALKEWMKRSKKNRIDVYYLEVDEVAKRITRERTLEELNDIKADLVRIRRRAFDELIAERLDANESFTIFQDFLRSEISQIDDLRKLKHREPVAG